MNSASGPGSALIDRIIDLVREQARRDAELVAMITEFIDLRRGEPTTGAVGAEKAKVLPSEFAADEVAAALGWSTNRVRDRARTYRRLRSALPRTCALWRAGAIDGYQASKVVQAADRLTWPESVTALDDGFAERAATQTATQLGRWLSRKVASLEPDQANRRHHRAMSDRKVCPAMEPDGMGSLWMMTGAADIAAIDDRLSTMARELGADDPRTMDQRRTDLAVDLMLGRRGDRATSSSPALGVVVPVQSLLGVDDTPGELADRSNTVPAELARDIASRPDTLFYRLLTDERGHLLDVSELGRFPSAALGLAIDVRDGTCTWPTCTTPASRCDRDHTVPAPQGPTAAANLGNGCRPHHRAKTHAAFDLRQPEPGVFVWTTPSGHTYVRKVEPLPVGRWPHPTVVDHHTPLAELIVLVDDTDGRTWEADVRAAFGPDTGPEPLLRSEVDLIVAAD
ncbi:MAG TPA: DUF222 domain-containing protein [Nocardioidaceae bacterium]|nr:DUF222 domain-containing protein [Nocardioidaceae bacterium]